MTPTQVKLSVDPTTGTQGEVSILTPPAGVGEEGQATGQQASTSVAVSQRTPISPLTYRRYHQHCVIASSTVVSSDGQVVLSVVRDSDLCRGGLNSEW